ncbi:MAG: BTAD domain-containing putative transcriptional regulator [Actinomycetota bacterium]
MAGGGLAGAREARLRAGLLGPFRLTLGGQHQPLRLPAGKATTLAAFLVARRGSLVAADEVIDALWEGGPPPGAAQNVSSLVSRLRAVLGQDAITGGRTGYRFETSGLDVDVDEVEALVAEAATQQRAGRPSLASSAVARALAVLATGPFLEDYPYAAWAEDGRRRTEALARRAYRTGWESTMAVGDHAAALALAEQAVRVSPLDEEAHRAAIRALHLSGDSARALEAYTRLRDLLAEELGVSPSGATEELYLAVLRGEDLSAEGPGPAPGPAATGARPGPTRLVGRDQELERLTERWAAAVAGHPGAVVVAGPSGSGRTAISTELADRARAAGGVVLWATCHQAERSLFLQPVVDALEGHLAGLAPERARALAGEHAGVLARLAPDLAAILPPEDGHPGTAELEYRRSLQAVAAVVRSMARDNPVLAVFDDLHHAGDSTLAALQFLLRRGAGAPLLVLGTAVGGAAPEVAEALGPGAHLLELGPLTLAAVQELAETASRPDLDPGALLDATGGNAQFVVEALRQHQTGTDGAPPSLAAAVLDRVRQLGRDVEDFLRVAAVLGTSFDLDFVAELASVDEEEASRLVERALAAGLLTSQGPRLQFAASALREALYESTPEPVRASRHRRAAARLADRPEAAAAHHRQVGAWPEAWAASTAAAEQAVRAFAIRDAERLFGEAIEAAGQAGDLRAGARARLRRGQMREELADYEGARRDHAAALATARELGDEEIEAAALERLGWTAYYGRDSAAAGELAAQAADLAESAAAFPVALPSALVLVGRTRHWAGDIAGAAEAYEAALAREPDGATRASALSCLGALLEHGDRFAEARHTLDQAAAEAARTGAFRPLLRTLFFAGLARANLGDFGGALRALERKRRLLEQYEVHFYRARTDTTLSWVWRELGQPGRAHDLAEQALQEAAEVAAGALQVEQELHALLALAECSLEAGDPDQAHGLVSRAEPLLEGWLPFRWRAELRLRDVRCRLGPADGEADELLDLARQRGSRKYEALALGHLGRRTEAAEAAAATGSDLLVAEVAPGPAAAEALGRVAAGLPVELREALVRGGRLARALATRG